MVRFCFQSFESIPPSSPVVPMLPEILSHVSAHPPFQSVKLRLNVEGNSPHGVAGSVQYPPFQTAKLKLIWNKVDQQLFMNEHLDK